MGRKLTIEPRWLVSMILAWVRYESAQVGKGLGYPDRCVFLTERVGGSRAVSSDGVSLNAYDKQDFDKIAQVMKELALTRPELYAAVSMYYRPWTIAGLQMQGYPFSPSKTYYRRLHDAHVWLAERLCEIEQRFSVPASAHIPVC